MLILFRSLIQGWMNRVIVDGIIQLFSGLKCAYLHVYSLGFKTAAFSIVLQLLPVNREILTERLIIKKQPRKPYKTIQNIGLFLNGLANTWISQAECNITAESIAPLIFCSENIKI